MPPKNSKKAEPATVPVGARVYFLDKSGSWEPGVLENVDGTKASCRSTTQAWNTNSQSTANTTVPYDVDHVLAASVSAPEGIEDMTNLDVLHEGALQENVASRYFRDEIYTFVGPILISVNPYVMLPIYTHELRQGYRAGMLKRPHLYAVADRAYVNLETDGVPQSVLISGESGAGKTEATKIVLAYLTTRATAGGTQNAPGGRRNSAVSGVQQRILDANPVLEAFGNAKTVRNDNSSRFGKYFHVQFDGSGTIVGATVIKYLLEKSRVVAPANDERAYHVLYQLSEGASDEERAELFLPAGGARAFAYTSQSGCLTVAGMDDVEEYRIMRTAMTTLGISPNDQKGCMCLLAAILHLSNVKFDAEGDGSSVSASSKDTLSNVASLMAVDAGRLSGALVSRTMQAGRSGGGRASSAYTIPLSAQAAKDNTDALAKSLYSGLFDWLVTRINQNIDGSSKCKKSIGVLDIFGFECFKKNSFEQLCINWTNEKLQQQFVNYYFKLEQDEYKREGVGIDWVDFKDNQACLDLIETTKPPGIVALLQEESRLRQGTDMSLAQKLRTTLDKRPHFSIARTNPGAFIVHHFAGEVQYDCVEFLDKNRDTLSNDLLGVISATDESLLKEVFAVSFQERMEMLAAGKSGAFVANQFKEQLTSLMSTLNASTPHYVRTIKPNAEKLSRSSDGSFKGAMVMEQLRYSGVLESIQIRKAGYAGRMDYVDFCQRFKVLMSDRSVPPGKQGAQSILAKFKIDPSTYTTGNTKIFFKTSSGLQELELELEKIKTKCAIVIQKYFRRYYARQFFKKAMKAIRLMQHKARGAMDRRRFVKARKKDRAKALARLARLCWKEAMYCVRFVRRLRQLLDRASKRAAGGVLEPDATGWDAFDTELKKNRMNPVDGKEKIRERCMKIFGKDSKLGKDIDAGHAAASQAAATTPTQSQPRVDADMLDVQIGEFLSDARAPPPLEHLQPLKAGWLLKEGASGGVNPGGSSDAWRLRYCVLTVGRLLFFNGGDCSEMRSEVSLRNVDVVEDTRGTRPDPTYQHVFSLRSTGRTIRLAAATDANRGDWMTALKGERSRALAPGCGAAAAVVRMGWLWRQSGRGGRAGWKRRFFSLRDTRLAWYMDETCTSLRGEMVLTASCAVSRSPVVALPRGGHGMPGSLPPGGAAQHDNWIGLTEDGKTLVMSADTRSEAARWFRDLDTVLSTEHQALADRLRAMGAPDVHGRACLRQGWAYRRTETGAWKRVWTVLTSSDAHFFAGSGLDEQQARLPLNGISCEALGRERVIVDDPGLPPGTPGPGLGLEHVRTLAYDEDDGHAILTPISARGGGVVDFPSTTPRLAGGDGVPAMSLRVLRMFTKFGPEGMAAMAGTPGADKGAAIREEFIGVAHEDDAFAWRTDIERAARCAARPGVAREGWLAMAKIPDGCPGGAPLGIGSASPAAASAIRDRAMAISLGNERTYMVSGWRRRYFVLSHGRLTCYADAGYAELRGEYRISSCTASVSGVPARGRSACHASYPYLLELRIGHAGSSTTRTVLLGAASEESMWAWASRIDAEREAALTAPMPGHWDALPSPGKMGGGAVPPSPVTPGTGLLSGTYDTPMAAMPPSPMPYGGSGFAPTPASLGTPGAFGSPVSPNGRPGAAPAVAPLLGGWLSKQGRSQGVWRVRYFQLFPHCLRYYEDADCAMLKGELPLKGMVASVPDVSYVIPMPSNSVMDPLSGGRVSIESAPLSTLSRFTLASPRRIVDLAAESASVRDTWLLALERALEASIPAGMSQPYNLSEAKVHLPDGSHRRVGIDDATTATDVARAIAELLGLKALLPHFALVETCESSGGIGQFDEVEPRVLRERESLSQTFSRWNNASLSASACGGSLVFQLHFCKVLFVSSSEEAASQDDAVLTELCFYQAAKGVCSHLKPDHSSAVVLAGLHARATLGARAPPPGYVVNDAISHVPGTCVNAMSPLEWEEHVTRSLAACRSMTAHEAMSRYVRGVRNACSLYGSMFYQVSPENMSSDVPNPALLAVNERGFIVVDPQSKQEVVSFPYRDVVSWATTPRGLTIVLGSERERVRFAMSVGRSEEAGLFAKAYCGLLATNSQY